MIGEDVIDVLVCFIWRSRRGRIYSRTKYTFMYLARIQGQGQGQVQIHILSSAYSYQGHYRLALI